MRGGIILVMSCLKRLGEAVQKCCLRGLPACMVYSSRLYNEASLTHHTAPWHFAWGVQCACEGGETADAHAEDDSPMHNRLTMPRTVATIVKMHPKAKQSRPPRKPPENMAGKDCRRQATTAVLR